MTLIDKETVLARANELYAREVLGARADKGHYLAPELWPKIESRQVKAIAAALVDEINLRLEAVGGWD